MGQNIGLVPPFTGGNGVPCAAGISTTLAAPNGAGAAGDSLFNLLVTPTTTAPGDVSLQDGSLAPFVVAKGGTLTSLQPYMIPMNLRSRNGSWKVVCGANVQALATGRFS